MYPQRIFMFCLLFEEVYWNTWIPSVTWPLAHFFSWGRKAFKWNHSSPFKIDYNYEGFLGEMISCREHLQIPPECTTGCGVRWHPFPTLETANSIHSCPILLKHGQLWSLLKLRIGKLSWVHARKVSPEGLWGQSLSSAPTLSGLGGRWCCLVQWSLLWVSRPLT